MPEQLSRNWWVFALRGTAAVVFGLIAFAQPGITLAAVVWLWGGYAVVDGVVALVAAVRAVEHGKRRGWLLLDGVTGIAAGFAAFAWTGITALALLYLVAAWAIVTGCLEIAAAIWLRKAIEGEWRLGLSGVLSVMLGTLLVANPGAGLVTMAWLVGGYAVTFGILMVALAFRLRERSQPSLLRPAAQ